MQQRSQPEYDRLEKKLTQKPADEVAVSIISFHEQAQGWLSWINKGKKEQILRGYARLHDLLSEFGRMNVLAFASAAYDKYQELAKVRLRIGTLDLRIASIALVHQAIVVSRNLRDF